MHFTSLYKLLLSQTLHKIRPNFLCMDCLGVFEIAIDCMNKAKSMC